MGTSLVIDFIKGPILLPITQAEACHPIGYLRMQTRRGSGPSEMEPVKGIRGTCALISALLINFIALP